MHLFDLSYFFDYRYENNDSAKEKHHTSPLKTDESIATKKVEEPKLPSPGAPVATSSSISQNHETKSETHTSSVEVGTKPGVAVKQTLTPQEIDVIQRLKRFKQVQPQFFSTTILFSI